DLPKGTVSASLNIVILSVSALSIEGARWLWFHGGRLPFHLLAVAAGIVAACCLARLLRHQREQAVIEARQS
ncbi:TPA: MFS transporter, partial [Klebsiella pneumoniae subsp. pneumoniae]|nr:MFS transporter [Klebsiella pneumoniae subsp. pneumoniae]